MNNDKMLNEFKDYLNNKLKELKIESKHFDSFTKFKEYLVNKIKILNTTNDHNEHFATCYEIETNMYYNNHISEIANVIYKLDVPTYIFDTMELYTLVDAIDELEATDDNDKVTLRFEHFDLISQLTEIDELEKFVKDYDKKHSDETATGIEILAYTQGTIELFDILCKSINSVIPEALSKEYYNELENAIAKSIAINLLCKIASNILKS